MSTRSSVIRVSVVADAKGMKQGMAQAEASVSTFQQAVGTAAGFIAAKFGMQALSAVKNFVVGSIQAAGDLEQSLGALQTVFEDNSSTIENWAKTSASSWGISKNEAYTSAVFIGSQLQNLGFDLDKTTESTIGLTERAADLAAMFNTTTKEALDAIASGLAGQSRPLKAYGIDISDAQLRQEALNMGLIETSRQLTANEKAAATISLIYKQSGKAAGQFARESDTLAGQQARLNAEWADAQAAIGEGLIPVVMELMPLLRGLVSIVGAMAPKMALGTKALFNLNDALGFTHDSMFELARISEAVNRQLDNGRQPMAVAADALGDLAAKGEITTEAFEKLMGMTGLTNEEMIISTQFVLDNAEAYGLNAEQIEHVNRRHQDLARTIDREAIKAQDDYTESAMEGAWATKQAAKANQDAERTVKSLAEAQRAAVDPVFALVRADRDYNAAKAERIALEEKGLTGSPAWIAAVEAETEAAIDRNEAARTFNRDVGPGQIKALENLLRQMGLTETQIREMFKAWNLNNFEPKSLVITGGGGLVPSDFFIRGGSGRAVGHTGGVFRTATPGGEGTATLQDGERVIPRGGDAGTGGNTYNITVPTGIGDPNAIARAVVEALQTYERNNGPVPINTRFA